MTTYIFNVTTKNYFAPDILIHRFLHEFQKNIHNAQFSETFEKKRKK